MKSNALENCHTHTKLDFLFDFSDLPYRPACFVSISDSFFTFEKIMWASLLNAVSHKVGVGNTLLCYYCCENLQNTYKTLFWVFRYQKD